MGTFPGERFPMALPLTLCALVAAATPARAMERELDGYGEFRFGMERSSVERLARLACDSARFAGLPGVTECRSPGPVIVGVPTQLLFLFRGTSLYTVIVRLPFEARQPFAEKHEKYRKVMESLLGEHGPPDEESDSFGGGVQERPGLGASATWWGPKRQTRLWVIFLTDTDETWMRVGYTDQAALDSIKKEEERLEAERAKAKAKGP